ncbi:hypothetical protein [Neisseria shayeganii]|uniref:Uncharacterized protein n=1 Tax=Neisseria shayeganii 871 TaxID=1032488 RepID=G4CG95_9NEIS|nr:hypothetical protein [Neisseria shayeganii]EGY53143.1 hypothetical protein HMPREF9371_0634 [Neisseria shayeganii 871]
MFDYAELEAVAADVLADFGRDCTVTVETEVEYDVETGTVSGSLKTHAGKCVFGSLTEKHIGIFNSMGASHGSANLVQMGDALVTATASCRLAVGALLECGDERWRIVNVLPIKPAAVVVAYQAHTRKESL